MQFSIKNVLVYSDAITKYFVEEFTYKNEVPFQFFSSEMRELVPRENSFALPVISVEVPLFNGSGYGKIVSSCGHKALVFLLLRSEYYFETIITEPDDVIIDIYYGETGLIYSFYNASNRNSITLTLKIKEDIEGVYRKIKAHPEDLNWRQYFVRKALQRTGTSSLVAPIKNLPENMTAEQVAEYLNVETKTVRNWTHENKIPYIKLGSAVRYPKNKIDDALSKSQIGNGKKKKK